MSVVEQFPYCDRNPASAGLDLMPDLPIVLRHQSQSLSGMGLVDSGASISVLPYSLGVQLGFDWNAQKMPITLAGTLAHVAARGIVVEAAVEQLPPCGWRWPGPNRIKFRFCSGSSISFRSSMCASFANVGSSRSGKPALRVLRDRRLSVKTDRGLRLTSFAKTSIINVPLPG